jgi:hypothetical protein
LCSFKVSEENVKKRNLIFAIAPVTFALAAACSSARGDERDGDGAASRSGDETTIAGCLSTDAGGRYALTVMPDPTASAVARGFEGESETRAYVLVGGDNLQAHLGKRVEVVGTVEGKTIDIEHKATKEQQEPAASGGDNNQPSVKTKEEIDVEARQLHVREVRDVAGTCPGQ